MNYELSPLWTTLLVVAVIWEFIWKGLALWRAAHNSQPIWFWVMLFVNTVGILPIVYLLTHQKQANHPPTPNRSAFKS